MKPPPWPDPRGLTVVGRRFQPLPMIGSLEASPCRVAARVTRAIGTHPYDDVGRP